MIKITGPDPDGSGPLTAPITSYGYDAVGNQISMTDPRGNTTSYGYDANNRLASVTTPLGNITSYSYDRNGNLASTVDPRGNVAGCGCASQYTTSYTYDAAGRLLTTTDPLGDKTTNVYDAVGNLASVSDANNHTTSYTYDAAGRVLTVTAPDGGITNYTYDPVGNELSRTDANNHTTTYTYNANGQLLTSTDPLNHVTSNTYDANSNLATTMKPSGGTITNTYDHANELTGTSYSDGTPTVTYGYDANGNRSSMADGSGTVSYTYDNLNRLTAVTRGSNTFSYAYDANGNVTSRTYPGGTTTTYSYDFDNRMATVVRGSQAVSLGYNNAGELTTLTYPQTAKYISEARVYDRVGRLTAVEAEQDSSGGPGIALSGFTQTLDPVGNPLQVTRYGDINSTTTYGYDANDRLSSVCFQASCPGNSDPYIRWTYDKVGNRLTETRPSGTTTYTYNAGDQLTKAGTTTYSYDANGNEVAAGSTTLAYNLANQLKTLTSGSTTTTYTYDGNSNRLQASTGSTASKKTNFLWDINNALPQLALERDGNNNPLRTYLYGPRLLQTTAGGTTYTYSVDPTGSVSLLTDVTGATKDWTYAYEPFGTTATATKGSGSAPVNPIQFTSQYLDPTGLYYLRAREYDPTLGRFVELDPFDDPASEQQSPYLYAGARPTVMTDPSGDTFQPVNTGTTVATLPSSRSLSAVPGSCIQSRSAWQGKAFTDFSFPWVRLIPFRFYLYFDAGATRLSCANSIYGLLWSINWDTFGLPNDNEALGTIYLGGTLDFTTDRGQTNPVGNYLAPPGQAYPGHPPAVRVERVWATGGGVVDGANIDAMLAHVGDAGVEYGVPHRISCELLVHPTVAHHC